MSDPRNLVEITQGELPRTLDATPTERRKFNFLILLINIKLFTEFAKQRMQENRK